MRTNFRFGLLIAAISLVGCAASPIVGGDSKVEPRAASYPKPGQTTVAAQGGLVHLKADYSSRFTFRVKEPVSTRLALGKIFIGTEEPLIEAQLESAKVYCSAGRTYIDPLKGPFKRSCLIEGEKGKFNQVKAAPGEVWYTRNLESPVSFESVELPVKIEGKPFKRELMFEGVQNGKLFLTERVYENNLESPSRARPLQVSLESFPSVVSVNGISLKVLSASESSLTYELVKGWD